MTDEPRERPDRTIQFVCQHGAFRSRIAAAYFEALAPTGWTATTGGVTPQAEVSERLRPLLEGTVAQPFIDESAPRSARSDGTMRTIVIDADLPTAHESWWTADDDASTDEEVRDSINRGVERLIRGLPGTPAL